MIESPVFLVGAERSGTTLLRAMICHHPQIAWSREFEYAVDYIPETGWPDLQTYYDILDVNELDPNGVFRSYAFTIDRSLDYPQLIDSFLVQLRERAGKPLVGATVHRHFDRLLRIWPDARFIHLLRDGRDVASSAIAMDWASQMWTGCQRWIDAERLWERLAAEVPETRRIDIRFEPLIRQPKESLTRICDFLSVPYDSAMLDYPDDTTYGPPDVAIISRWQRRLSPKQVQLAEARIADMLLARGYELSGHPRFTVLRWRQRMFGVQDHLQNVRSRFKRYGPRLCLANAIAARIGAKSWQKRVLQRINDVEAARLK